MAGTAVAGAASTDLTSRVDEARGRAVSGNAFQLMSPFFFSLLQAASHLLTIQAGMVAKG